MPTLQTEADKGREEAVAKILSRKWDATLYRYGDFAPIDWYFVRDGRVVAVAELKVRRIDWGCYPTIYLAHTKWLHLRYCYDFNNVGAFFVVQVIPPAGKGTPDRLFYIPVQRIVPAYPVRVRGRPSRPGAPHDQEPMVEVPCSQFTEILYRPAEAVSVGGA